MVNEENNAIEVCTSSAAKTVTAEFIWEAAFTSGYPVAIWRLPESDRLRLIVSENLLPGRVVPDLEKLESGFLLAPFSSSAESAVLFLEGSLILSFPVGQPAAEVPAEELDDEDFRSVLFKKAIALQENAAERALPDNTIIAKEAGGDEERFRRIVQLGAEAVRAGELFKVVLSRTREFEYSPGFSFISAFFQLEAAYASAFVSMVSLPHLQEVWLGASPELLVGISRRRHFKTVALAGTQSATDAAGAVKPKFKVLWSEKEIEEQAIVSRYIIECFKKIRLREYVETGPKSSKAGNLYHLKSDFEVDLEAVNFPELGSVMLKLLHPTSAVCGMPREEARALITSLEGNDRSLYSGYWGPVNVADETCLFVNLRTLRAKNGIMTLFAGAGITADSDPGEEWNETELKCDTLLRVIAPGAALKR